MLVRTSLFIGILISILTCTLALAPAADISAAQRLTPTPRPTVTVIRPRIVARSTPTPPRTVTLPLTRTVTVTQTVSQTVSQTGLDADRMAAGKQIYLEHYCGSCHRLAAAATTGIFGPAHDHIGTVAAQRIANPRYRGTAKTAAEYIRESIVAPAAFLAPTAGFAHQQMPPFPDLAPEELDALVYFLLQQK
jgi:mono/diheme cytochrome c family protein